MRVRGIRIIEIATVCAVLGILVSLAIPTLMRMQARSRVDHLLASARSCREELPRWLSDTLSSHPAASEVTDQGGAEAQSARDLLENYARIYNERLEQMNLPGEKPLLVVEPSGTLPVYCRRDARIHLIPFVDSAQESVGATVVVTDQDRRGGPACDGILAVYNVEPGTE
jgi:type II secretory pathway pseudopilin PulG